jgi:hypothetical protein
LTKLTSLRVGDEVGLTLEAVTRHEMPLDWDEQRRLYAAG